jgi:hypothetical protein
MTCLILPTDTKTCGMPQSMHPTHSTAQPPSPPRAPTLLLPPTPTDLWHPCSRHRPHDVGCPHQGILRSYERANRLQSKALPTKQIGTTQRNDPQFSKRPYAKLLHTHEAKLLQPQCQPESSDDPATDPKRPPQLQRTHHCHDRQKPWSSRHQTRRLHQTRVK